MASIGALTSSLTAMMLMVAVGFAIVRLGLLKTTDSRALSALTVYVLQPCLILRSFQMEITPQRLQGFLAVLMLGFAYYLLFMLVIRLLKKPLRLDAIDQATLIYSNVGNLILPLVSMVLGDEYVFYGSAMQIPFNLFVWTHARWLISGERGLNIKKLLLNTNLIAMLAGLLLFALQLHIPDPIDKALSGLAGMVGPASMLVVGMVIAGRELKSVFVHVRVWAITAGRLLVMPLVTMGLLALTGVLRATPALVPVLQVAFMALAAPPASTVSQLAVLYQNEPEKASSYNVLGMCCCILTMPLTLWIYQLLFV